MTGGIYQPASGAFSPTGDMVAQPYPGGKHAILLPDGRVFMAPGQATTLLQDGRVFVAGYPTAQLYDPVINTFAATAPYVGPPPAVLQRATLLADGRVLLTGAVNICFQPLCKDPGTSWAELFDPVSGAFAPAGSMKGYNNIYTATLLPNGKVLFAGSDTYNGVPPFAEVFDPSNGTFTAIEGPSTIHEYGAATLLPDGTVLITGGFIPGGEAQVISELYIQASARFSTAGMMSAARRNHTSTLLSDGTVLIAGGETLGPSITSSAELYHPAISVPSPFLYTRSGDDTGQGAIWHSATGQLASPDHPVSSWGDTVDVLHEINRRRPHTSRSDHRRPTSGDSLLWQCSRNHGPEPSELSCADRRCCGTRCFSAPGLPGPPEQRSDDCCAVNVAAAGFGVGVDALVAS